MEGEIITYALRWNGWGDRIRDFFRGERETKLFLHAPDTFFVGLVKYNFWEGKYSLDKDFLNKEGVYVSGDRISEYKSEMDKDFEMMGEPIKIELNDEDIESIRMKGESFKDRQKDLQEVLTG